MSADLRHELYQKLDRAADTRAVVEAYAEYNASLVGRLQVQLIEIGQRLDRIEKHLRLDEREAGEP